jgi:hypothetical protein
MGCSLIACTPAPRAPFQLLARDHLEGRHLAVAVCHRWERFGSIMDLLRSEPMAKMVRHYRIGVLVLGWEQGADGTWRVEQDHLTPEDF